MNDMTIGQLARQASVKVATVRYYERRRLLANPPRRSSGYRQYAPDALTRLQFIRRAQELGFSLREIAELLSLRVTPRTTCAQVKRKAEAKLADIETRIQSLQRMREALRKLAAECSGQSNASACPILEALETGEATHA